MFIMALRRLGDMAIMPQRDRMSIEIPTAITSTPVVDGLFRRRQMLLQFGQYLADFCPFRHSHDLRVLSNSELMMLAYGLKHLKHFRVFLFGQKIYLKIEMVSLIRLDVAAVLAHEDEQREENRFQ